MAATDAIVWELRTTGSDSNGGGFITGASGTDFSQQDAAQSSGSDLASVSSLVVSSASHNFVASDVGNVIQISGGTGFTAGFYEIKSVASNQATLDRSPGTVGVNGVWAVGGALLTPAKVITAGKSLFGDANSTLVYVKAGTYTITSSLAFNAFQSIWIGYTTTRTDNGRATITTATNSTVLADIANEQINAFKNFIFSNTASTRAVGFDNNNSQGGIWFENCLFDGFTIALNFISGNLLGLLVVTNCEIKNSTTRGVDLATGEQTSYFQGCYIHDNTGDGLRISAGSPNQNFINNCIFKSNTGHGFSSITTAQLRAGTKIIICNSAFLNNTGSGIKDYNTSPTGNGQCLVIFNSIIDSNGAFGIELASINATGAPNVAIGRCNAFRNNTSGDRSNFPTLPGDIALTGDPFTNRGANDFTLNSTAGAGAACKAAGFETIIF